MNGIIGFENEEMAVMNLSRLYSSYGFKQFKMSKFEEYDLYAKNKDFLLGSNVITFTDTNGKLMALKPDVTLSIVKGSGDNLSQPEKVYYSENVYRVDKGTHQFKEIMQVGLECVGDIDTYCMSEVIMLAKKSLSAISERNILDISHMGFITGILDETGLSDKQKKLIVSCISEKNTLAISNYCSEFGIEKRTADALIVLTGLYGSFSKSIEEIQKISINEKTDEAVEELKNIYEFLRRYGCADGVNIDFSIVNDLKYYNGVIFQGFVDGVPSSVLTGGRYDNLVRRLGKKTGAIGFAVYLDLLSRLMCRDNDYDTDVLLIYDDKAGIGELADAVKKITDSGKSVKAQKQNDGAVKYKQLMKLLNGEVKICETND
ncbi:MAG: ATP phosphoribosyltransferase regulatory subunit [Clostridia bacterium]|nr:ATP phosphoribosyltransferase regulatory subunit [Clostridia bacterium]